MLGINQNRATNGDIVCLEVLPENEWIKNFKIAEPVNILEQDLEKIDNFDEEEEKLESENTTLMERINREKERRVTAKVRGILKKMNKTYGGSILNPKDMKAETKTKFELLCSNLNISKSEQRQYRVFVPYNVQIPQAIIKSTKPEALENLRFIVRLTKWSVKSPFP